MKGRLSQMVVDELRVTNYAQNYVDGTSGFAGSPDFDADSYFAQCEVCDWFHTCYDVTIVHIPSQGEDKCTICQDCIYAAHYGDSK